MTGGSRFPQRREETREGGHRPVDCSSLRVVRIGGAEALRGARSWSALVLSATVHGSGPGRIAGLSDTSRIERTKFPRVRDLDRRRGITESLSQYTALTRGEHALGGFTNRDLRTRLDRSSLCLDDDPRRRSAQVSRLLDRLHAYRLGAKIPHSRRWRLTDFGWRVMSAALERRSGAFPEALAAAA